MIRNADEMFQLAIESREDVAKEIFDKSNLRNCLISKIEEYSKQGRISYNYIYDQLLIDNRDVLMNKILSMTNEFEDKGYKIIIKDGGNGYWSRLSVTVYWGIDNKEFNRLINKKIDILGREILLYSTKTE